MTQTRSFEKVRDAMAARTAAAATTVLCNALLLLEGRELDNSERMVQAVISDELCKRHPSVDAASLRWSEDAEATETHTEVIVTAALNA